MRKTARGRTARSLPRGKVRRIGGLVARVGGRAFARRGFREAALLTECGAAIVGAEFAARCAPQALRRDGTLVLRADGGTALLLQHIEPQLRERIAAFAGYEAVKRIVYRQHPLPPAPAAPAAPEPAREAPRDARGGAGGGAGRRAARGAGAARPPRRRGRILRRLCNKVARGDSAGVIVPFPSAD